MSPGLNIDSHPVVAAFRSALLHQGLFALLVFTLLVAAWVVVRDRVRPRQRPAQAGPEPAGRLLLTVGFGNLWLFDGILQLQSKMALGLPSQVIEPIAASSPRWVQHLVNWAGTTWSYHPVEAATAAVWIQLGLGIWMLAAPRGPLSRLAGIVSVGWGLVVWVFGESFGAIFAPGLSWLSGAPGAALFYVAAGVLIALPESAWRSARIGRLMLAGLGLFAVGMAVLQAWPGRGFWQGVSHGQLGSVAGMAESMTLTPQPGFLIDALSRFADLDAAHGFAVNLFFVVVLAVAGVAFVSGRARLIRPVLIGFAAVCLAAWVVTQDLGFLGGLGTDPNSMIPLILLAVSGYLAYVRPVAQESADTATVTESVAGDQASPVPRARVFRRQRVVALSFWSLTALAGAGLIVLGAIPMAVAQASPNADPILAEAIAGPSTPTDYLAPGFALTDQFGQAVTLAGLRGKIVLLGFIDPACAAQCQPIGREFERADAMLGASAARVALVGIDLPETRRSLGELQAYDGREDLSAVSGWRFLTGTFAQLRQVWQAYGVGTGDREPGGSGGASARSGVVFVIGPEGRVRDRYNVGPGPGTAATESSFAVVFADAARRVLALP
jgi:cytochrome oxidase Cu insertion factor (SCO1/SenC/PrrC family)